MVGIGRWKDNFTFTVTWATWLELVVGCDWFQQPRHFYFIRMDGYAKVMWICMKREKTAIGDYGKKLGFSFSDYFDFFFVAIFYYYLNLIF